MNNSRVRLAFTLLFAANLALGQTALTIYNQNFAVVRDRVPMRLSAGMNRIRYEGATAFLEPDSVILSDPAGKVQFTIREQSYRADPVSSASLLRVHEGKTIEFLVTRDGRTQTLTGKIIRAGYSTEVSMYQQAGMGSPIVEIDGRLYFNLPGVPLFPPMPAGTIVKPLLEWAIESGSASAFDADLSYISNMLNWEASYNAVAQEKGDSIALTGWVTINNQSGKTFPDARIKLMAGDVQRLTPQPRATLMAGVAGGGPAGGPAVSEKTFDDYHLYTLEHPATLHQGETKQVEFLRVAEARAKTVYVYDGMKVDDQRFRFAQPEAIRTDSAYGSLSNPKVWVMREFENSKANRLGLPLPKGRVRFHRRDADGRLEFTGEDTIRHTPAGETVRVFTGSAFDIVGDRKRTNFRVDHGRSMAEESFEIRVRNRKAEAVAILVVEHLNRASSWEIFSTSLPFMKSESQKVEWTVPLQPGEEKVVTYSVRYTW